MKTVVDPYNRFTKLGSAERDWMLNRACVDVDPEIFFPNPGGSGPMSVRRARKYAEAALAFCNTCPVTNECLDYAVRLDNRYGVWGGKTELERDLDTDERRPKR